MTGSIDNPALDAQSAKPRPRSVRIAHLSDPHFGTIPPSVEAGMRATLQRLNPDQVVISGDLTQRARRAQFAAVARFIESLAPLPFVVIPGNHDIPLYNLPVRLFRPYLGFEREFGRELAPIVELDGVQIVTFVSAPPWRHKHGDIDVRFVAERLRKAPPSPGLRIAVFHHPFDSFERVDEKNIIRRAPRLLEALNRHGVDLVLGGHIHDALARTTEHRYPRLDRHLVLALAGTCMSWRTRYRTPNTFNLLHLVPELGELTVERWDCQPGDPGVDFHSVAHNTFVRNAAGSWEILPGR